jgi:hypothetical protein
MSAFLMFVVFFQSVFAAGKDLDESCAFAGRDLDQNYRLSHPHEPLQLFPLANKCNALYDTVPAWTNPMLAVLAILTMSFFAVALATVFIRVKSRI